MTKALTSTALVFAADDYKLLIRDLSSHAGVAFARVAEAAGIHRQYLGKVLQSKGHLSDEQAHRIGEFFALDDDALAYFLILVQEGKTSHPSTKRYFAKRRLALRRAQTDLETKLSKATRIVESAQDAADLAEFFLEVELQLCHAYLFIPTYQRDMTLLAASMRLSLAEVQSCIGRLKALGLITSAAGRHVSQSPFIHLKKHSSLSRQNHRNWRLYLANAATSQRDLDFSFTSTVTADRRARKALIDRLKEALGAFHRELPEATNEEVFQVNLDVLKL